MTAVNRRTRSVLFRVSEEEYKSLRSACAAAGGRSLSEFTRTELLLRLQGELSEKLFYERFSEIAEKLSEVQRMVNSVFESIRSGMASAGIREE